MKNTVIESPGRSRPAYRPPLGLPLRRESRWGTLVSMLFHALVILLILAPLMDHDVLLEATRGGLGPGPAGGGGGGSKGAAGRPREEHIQFVRSQPQVAAAPIPTPVPPKPVIPPPQPPTVPTLAKIDVKIDAGPPVAAPNFGDAGTLGAGPGTGGGIGTGTGPGRGSGTGPGTGGGAIGDTALANAYFSTMPLSGVPHSLSGKQVVVRFALDDRGNILRIDFASTGSSSFDKSLRETLKEWKFHAAFLRSSGIPVPSVYETQIGF